MARRRAPPAASDREIVRFESMRHFTKNLAGRAGQAGALSDSLIERVHQLQLLNYANCAIAAIELLNYQLRNLTIRSPTRPPAYPPTCPTRPIS